MNVYDSSRIASILNNLNWAATPYIKEADLVIFNTCHIREKAAEKVFSDLGRLYKIKKERAKLGLNTIICVAGCVAQALGETITKRAPYVDIAIGPLNYHLIGEAITKTMREHDSTYVDTSFPSVSKFDFLPENISTGGCSYLAIQEGCNNFCSYCVVPYTRGREFSRPIKDVIAEAAKLIETGTLELNLLGQNVNSYHGVDASGKEQNLAYLINELAKIDGLKRLRYTTSYPNDMKDDLIQCHKDLDILMPYMHLPIQSGSDTILKAMKRRYNVSEYLHAVEKLKKANSKIEMSSDFIVGFPGESEQDFKNTLELVKEVGFIQAFSFKYSPRPGTPAAIMSNQIPEEIKSERLEILQDLLFSQQLRFNKESVDKIVPVLFENKGRHDGQLIGRTPYMQNLHADLSDDYLNKIINIKVTNATTNSLSGRKE